MKLKLEARALKFALMLILSMLGPCYASDAPGSSGFSFLKLGASGRQMAMGGAGLALPGEALSADLNPAALAEIKAPEVYFSYQSIFEDMAHGNIGYAHPLRRHGTLNADLKYLDYGSIEAVDTSGTPAGTVGASDRMLRLGWGAAIAGFAHGINLKIVQEKLDNVAATAFAVDAGFLYRPRPKPSDESLIREHLRRISLGLALRHFGPKSRFDEASEELPRTIALGLAYAGWGDTLSLALDIDRSLGQRSLATVGLGCELWLKDVLALRLGFRGSQDIGPGISSGFGVKISDARIDYSLAPYGALGLRHRVTLSYRFGSLAAQRYYEEGVRLMRLGYNPEAVMQFNKALAIDPNNRRVLKKAQEAARALEDSLKER